MKKEYKIAEEDATGQSSYKYKITTPDGEVYYTDNYTDFSRKNGLNHHGFAKVLCGLQVTCYGGYKIEKLTGSTILKLAQQGVKKLELIDVVRRENCHKIKFTTKQGDTVTRKLNISKVGNLKGERCSLTGNNILLGELVGKCKDSSAEFNFSIEELKKLGYSFDLDLTSPTTKVVEKVVTKEVKIFSADLLEEHIQDKREQVLREIKATQNRLNTLNLVKENLGKSLSQISFANKSLKSVDEVLTKYK